MKKYYGNHVGIVIQNNDPDKAGKIKVFVPHISSTVYNNWVKSNTNKKIKFIGNNIDEDLTEIIHDLKRITPWADCAAPLAGENTSGRFNNFNLTGSVSDSNFYDTVTSSTSALTGIGGAPSNFYDETIRVSDAFVKADNNVNRPNPLAYEYKPNAYSNEAKGSFCIPAVGAHVWVFFREGNPNFPVYFAASFGQSDWQGIYESQAEPGLDYPDTYENKNAGITEYDHNVEAYRNKYVINQKGGSLEFVNSDLNEKMRLTHYSGSFKEMNNQSTVELSSKNKQNLVLNDSYDTVRGFKNEYTGKNLDEIVYRDKYKKVGSLNAEYFDKWKDVVAGIQEFKQLFEIKRTNDNSVKNDDGITVLKRNSLLQERDGTFASYPVTDGSIKYSALANSTNPGPPYTAVSDSSEDGPQVWAEAAFPGPGNANPAAGSWPSQSGQPWGPGGAGKSVSTQNGEWIPDENKDKLKELIEASLPELTEIENELGIGGSEIIQITKHKMETIGMLMNDFGSIRLDNIGKLVNNEVLVDSTSVYMNKVDSPLLEYVHVQDLPGGNYTLNVCNRYNVMVGAGGLNLKSYGAVNLTGTITNIAGEQVNIASENEVNIDAGTINISADILRLRNKRQRQILIENSLGVNKNVIVGGGLHVEGETYLQHVTAPIEYQKTEATIAYSKLLTGLSFSASMAGGSVGSTSWTGTVTLDGASNDDKVAGYAHSHVFPNLPLTLLGSNSDVRSAASGLNNTARDVAEPQHNEGK
tara:strand:+ start:842 stop:3100 length:2259 start_codon:yes stop_codon:yes gene_type:complete